jgi:hypothetical protein
MLVWFGLKIKLKKLKKTENQKNKIHERVNQPIAHNIKGRETRKGVALVAVFLTGFALSTTSSGVPWSL